ncbi:MAG: PHB depolymerase family esterase [Myxococcota bacterium]
MNSLVSRFLGVVILTLGCSSQPAVEAPAHATEASERATAALAQEERTPQLRYVERGQGPDVLVLLHGYGARGDDLVSFGASIARAVQLRVVVPEAPNAWRNGGEGRAWFEPRHQPLEGANAARGSLVELLAYLRANGAERIALAGFSQGAIMSLDVALLSDEALVAVGVLSGKELPPWESRYDTRPGLPIFMAHGRTDRVLGFGDAERLRDRLTAGGAEVVWLPFEGGHTIPSQVRQGLMTFLRQHFQAGPAPAAGSR